MIELMTTLPDDLFRQELMQYLTLHDIIRLDTAIMNQEYRTQLLGKIRSAILKGDGIYLEFYMKEYLLGKRLHQESQKLSETQLSISKTIL